MAKIKGLKNLGKVFGVEQQKTEKSANYGTPAVYEVLQVQERVLVKVPKESGFMVYCKAFKTAGGDIVPTYWKNGKPLNGGLFLNVHFFGITESNLGRNVVATVKVIKKTMSNDREYIMIDVINTPGLAPTHDLKLPEGNADGISIIGTNRMIEFRQREVSVRSRVAVTA